jgi:hypothetical protein
MIPVLQAKSAELAELCRSFGVCRLEVFGSAATDSFDPSRSDVDLLVAFHPGTKLGPWLGRYFDLRDALAKLLGRPVDLVMISALRNAYFIREVNRTRQLLYAA